MHGGVKVYRGNPAAARNYVEADHARVDDYYLAEGTGLAMRFVATPDGVEAYDAAQDRAAGQIIGWLAQHATTRVGPRGRQVQVPVERIEAATVRHYTSRAGDPHRHLHVQINARVWAEGKWRGLHTVGVRDMIDAVNGIGHAAVMCDLQFRQVLADRGFTINADTGEVNELAGFVGAFSARARQIGNNIQRYETAWRGTHPGQEPGPELMRTWDRRAWSQARPDKVVPTDGTVLTDRWVDELHRLGYRTPTQPVALHSVRTGALDRDAAANTILSRLGAKRSAWNAADIRGQVELLIAAEGIVADAAVRIELAEDLTARAIAVSVPLLDNDTPEHIRALTSRDVLGVEADLTNSFAVRGSMPGIPANITGGDLDEAQMRAVAILAGKHRLVLVEGAAGAGKTATLAGTQTILTQTGHRMIVVTPTLKAAQVVAAEAGVQAHSAAWLALQYGFSWDDDGCWTRGQSAPSADAVLGRGDLLLIDEAGMLDQDTARALVIIADETGARLALVGDRHQLPAVGRGGVLDLAASWVAPDASVTLDNVHRFDDPDYAKLSLAMRTGQNPEAVFDQLVQRGQIVLHSDEASRTAVLADEAAASGGLVVADTREQVADLNQAIRERHITAGQVINSRVLVTDSGERLGVGDRVATRRNDYNLGVANRDTWTITALADNGTMQLCGEAGTRELPYRYAVHDVELAYASTVYGARGQTTRTAHLVLGEHTGAASAYVAMTRGRHNNTAHLVAEDLDDARQQWILTFARNRTDLGPAHAARLAAEEAAKYEPYDFSRYIDRHDDSVPLSRRQPEPPPSYSSPSRGGPGIGF